MMQQFTISLGVFLLFHPLFGADPPNAPKPDQVVNLKEDLKELTNGPTITSITRPQAATYVQSVLGPVQSDRAYVLHVVKYQASKWAVETQKWHVYDTIFDSRWHTDDGSRYFTDTRILGRASLAVVWIHIVSGVPAARALAEARRPEVRTAIAAALPTIDPVETKVRAQIEGLVTSILQRDPANALALTYVTAAPAALPGRSSLARVTPAVDVSALTGTPLQTAWRELSIANNTLELAHTGATTGVAWVGTGRRTLANVNGVLVDAAFDKVSGVFYRAEITRKKPQPLQNAIEIANLAFGGQSAKVTQFEIRLEPVALAAGSSFQSAFVPSTMVINSLAVDGSKEVQVGSASYINERNYWYDFSLALPLSSHDDLKYEGSSDSFTVRKIDKRNLYAFFNAGLPRDLHRMRFQYLPVFVYGMPITSQPLRHHIFGLSIGLNKVNFFGGVRLDKKDFLLDYSKPRSSANLVQNWRTHSVFGLNFSVGTIVEALKSKAK
jgi:hypothetical protein